MNERSCRKVKISEYKNEYNRGFTIRLVKYGSMETNTYKTDDNKELIINVDENNEVLFVGDIVDVPTEYDYCEVCIISEVIGTSRNDGADFVVEIL